MATYSVPWAGVPRWKRLVCRVVGCEKTDLVYDSAAAFAGPVKGHACSRCLRYTWANAWRNFPIWKRVALRIEGIQHALFGCPNGTFGLPCKSYACQRIYGVTGGFGLLNDVRYWLSHPCACCGKQMRAKRTPVHYKCLDALAQKSWDSIR